MSTEKRGGKSAGKSTKSARKKASLPSFEFSDDLLKGTPEQPAGDTAKADTAKADTAKADTAKGAAEATPPQAPAERKISLPAYGFAADLLKGRKPSAGASERPAPPGRRRDKSAIPAGEDRIFTFADGLESGSGEAAPAAPVRLETWVSFSLAGETFALPVAPVHEVVRPSSITRVPHAPFPIRGVTNLRGRVVPVIDLRLRLELPGGEITRASRVVVVGSRGRRLGLLVDAVHQVIHIDVDRVQPPPDDVMTVQSDYILGVYHLGEQLVLLLDVDRVLIIKEPAASPAGVPAAGMPAAGGPPPPPKGRAAGADRKGAR